MLLFDEKFRQESLAAVIVIFIFALLTYACFKEPKHKVKNKSAKNNSSLIPNNGTGGTAAQKTTTQCFESDNTISHTDDKPVSNTEISAKPTAKNESDAEKLETAQKMLNESLNQLKKMISSGDIVKITVQGNDIPNASPKPGISYIEDDKIIARTDGEEISDDEIPYLIQVGYEQAMQAEKDSPNPKFHRTAHEKDLLFHFEMNFGHEIGVLTKKFESLYREAYRTNNLDKRITLLNETIIAFEKARQFCYSKGKGGTLYFQDMWEHLHNSNNPCFSYLDNIKDFLDESIYLKDEVIPEIINTIAKNDGILQKNIYKLLPDIEKSTIQHTLKLLESENKLSKIKKGNSYELHILLEKM